MFLFMNNLLSWRGLYAKMYGEECIKIMIQLNCADTVKRGKSWLSTAVALV